MIVWLKIDYNLKNHKRTFAVKCKTLDNKNSMEIEKELGEKIKKRAGLDVNLKNPDITVSCISDGDYYFTGIKINIK